MHKEASLEANQEKFHRLKGSLDLTISLVCFKDTGLEWGLVLNSNMYEMNDLNKNLLI